MVVHVASTVINNCTYIQIFHVELNNTENKTKQEKDEMIHDPITMDAFKDL